jgi:ethanolamine utilization protein EutA (predicted chaperonin)
MIKDGWKQNIVIGKQENTDDLTLLLRGGREAEFPRNFMVMVAQDTTDLKEFTRQAMISISLRPHTKSECLHLVRTVSQAYKDVPDFEKMCEEHAEKLEAFLKEFHKE